MAGKWQPNSLFPGAAPLAPTAKPGFLTGDTQPESDEDACPAFGYLRGIRDRALAVEFRYRAGNSDRFPYS